MLTIAGTVHFAHIDGYFLTNPWIPGFCRPIAFSIPAGDSTMRGMGFPARRAGVMPLLTNAPRRLMSMTPEYSSPYPKQPDAAMIGFCSRNSCGLSGARSTERSAFITESIRHPTVARDRRCLSQDHLIEIENWPFHTRGNH